MRVPLITFLARAHDQLVNQAAPDNVNYDSRDELVMCQERNSGPSMGTLVSDLTIKDIL